MKAKKVMFYCLAGLVAGCVPIASLNPLFTKGDIVFDEKLLGTWLPDANDPGSYWEFTRFEESSVKSLPEDLQSEFKQAYRLNMVYQGDQQGVLVACLVKLGVRRFLDIFPDRFPSGESEFEPEKTKLKYNADFFWHSHLFIRVDAIGDQLKVRFLDVNDFKKLVEAEPKAVAYAVTEKGPILTASTEELQAFVTKHADDGRLFTTELPLVRKNK